MKDFFISYNKADRQWAEWIAWQLEEAGFTTVIQAWDFRPGSNFVLDMHQAAAAAERTIAVLSPDYLQSLYTQPEWAAAFAQDPTSAQKKLLPVRVCECKLEGLLAQIVYIDLTSADADAAKEALLAGIKRERVKPTAPPGFPGSAHHAASPQPGFPGSIPIPSRNVDELIAAYCQHLEQRVGTVRLFGEEQSRPLDQVFVELTINEDYDRRPNQAEFLGLMDAELRKMRSVFGDADERREQNRDGDETARSAKPKRTVKPDELLRRHTHAVITGAPGCGKTTLLRYLAWQTLKAFVVPPSGGSVGDQAIPPEGGTTNARLPVFLELKQLTTADFAQTQLEDLLFHKAIAAAVKPRDEAERDALRQHFLERLRAGCVAIFLDGLDEVSGASFFKDLQTAVQTFLQSAYSDNTVILSTRPFALRQFGDAKMMEIQPLSPRQIEQFIEHYYRDVPERQQFQRELQRRRELRELARVPALLGFILQLWRKNGNVTDDKLELYAQITLELAQQLDREKEGIAPEREWLVEDKDGSLKLDLLRQLAFHQLFKGLIHPPYEVGGTANDVDRLVFTSEQLRAEAVAFARTLHEREGLTIHPRNLAEDVKATALLRQVGADHYAFAHLTLQEYLGAWQLAKRHDAVTCERIFCRAYFNPTLAEMEVLPMTLRLVDEPDKFYEALERLPESLTFTNLRLRVRGAAYRTKIKQDRLLELAGRLVELITMKDDEGIGYLDIVSRPFSALSSEALESIINRVASLRYNNDEWVQLRAVYVLGQIGDELAVEPLCKMLQEKHELRRHAVEALGDIASEDSVAVLVEALQDENSDVRSSAADALGQIGNEQAVVALAQALSQECDEDVLWHVSAGLKQIGNERAVIALTQALWSEKDYVRHEVVDWLRDIGSEQGVTTLVRALSHEDLYVKSRASYLLGKMKAEQAVPAFIQAARADDIEQKLNAFVGLGLIGSNQAVEFLIHAMQDEDVEVRKNVVDALGLTGDEQAVAVLMQASLDRDDDVRWRTTLALGKTGDEQAIAALFQALQSEESERKWDATCALGRKGGGQAFAVLIEALQSEDSSRQSKAAWVLGEIGDEQAATALVQALQPDKDGVLRDDVTKALVKLGGIQAVAAFIQALQSEDGTTRWCAAEALGEIGGERAVTALIQALQSDEDDEVRQNVASALGEIGDVKAVTVLISTLGDDNYYVRVNAAVALRQIEERERIGVAPAFVNELLPALLHENIDVRRKASNIVGYYADDEQAYKALSRLADADPETEVKEAAREALLKFGRKLQYFNLPIPTTTTNDSSPSSPPPPLTTSERAKLETRIAAKYREVLRCGDARQKGKAMEELLAAVFASIPGFTVSESNYHTAMEEIDLVLRNASGDPFWREMGSLILVEAKHWQSQRVGKNEYVQFYRKLENRGGHCQLGFLICTERFAETFHQESLRDSKFPLRVVPIDGEDLRRLVEAEERAAVLREFVERAVLR